MTNPLEAVSNENGTPKTVSRLALRVISSLTPVLGVLGGSVALTLGLIYNRDSNVLLYPFLVVVVSCMYWYRANNN